jgi:hypothetical protein
MRGRTTISILVLGVVLLCALGTAYARPPKIGETIKLGAVDLPSCPSIDDAVLMETVTHFVFKDFMVFIETAQGGCFAVIGGYGDRYKVTASSPHQGDGSKRWYRLCSSDKICSWVLRNDTQDVWVGFSD